MSLLGRRLDLLDATVIRSSQISQACLESSDGRHCSCKKRSYSSKVRSRSSIIRRRLSSAFALSAKLLCFPCTSLSRLCKSRRSISRSVSGLPLFGISAEKFNAFKPSSKYWMRSSCSFSFILVSLACQLDIYRISCSCSK